MTALVQRFMEENKDIKGYVVDGYLFESEKEAQTAQKELQGILYLQRNNNLKNIKVMKQIYEKLLKQGLFRTPVGLNYLKQLQTAIVEKEGAKSVSPIPVGGKGTEEVSNLRVRKTMQDLNDVGFKYRKRFRISVAVIGILSACLVFMLVLASTTNQPNILNYEEKLVDKYEHWEQELDEREKMLEE